MSADRGQFAGGPARAGEPSQPGPRKEVGSSASSRKHPPHVSENVEGAQVQQSGTSAEPIPALPPNAHGKDRSDMTDQPEIREGSAYENRPAEDKETPPSRTGGQ